MEKRTWACRSFMVATCLLAVGCGIDDEPPEAGFDIGIPERDAAGDVSNEPTPTLDVDPGDVDGSDAQDAGGPINDCGGRGALVWDGADALPGGACACGGVLICDESGGLRCDGGWQSNACGGCVRLTSEPDQPCGACGDGRWVCDGTDAVRCEGASLGNACGGCAPLAGAPGESCIDGDERAGVHICVGPETMRCVARGMNPCGGTYSAIERHTWPEDPCGVCGTGRYECDGRQDTVCVEPDAQLNSCGGCAALSAEPGESCGVCGGQWRCDAHDPNRVYCDDSRRNPCAGCETLPASPGGICETDDGEPGVFACAGTDAVACVPRGGNVCGGVADLGSAVGVACGVCDDGVTTCASRDVVACVGARPSNACGGCGELPGQPGMPCGWRRQWRCTETGTSECIAVLRDGMVKSIFTGTTLGDAYVSGMESSALEPTYVTIERLLPTYVSEAWDVSSPIIRVGPSDITLRSSISAGFISSEPRTLERTILASATGLPPFEEIDEVADYDFALRLSGAFSPPAVLFVGQPVPPPDCPDGVRNACGGCDALDGQEGDPCGLCGRGELRCGDWATGLVCDGDVVNACGGCAELDEVPGARCGPCLVDRLECADGGESLRCDGDSRENACGACGPLEGAPGDPCGLCGLDQLRCSSDGLSLQCDGDTRVNGCGGCDDLGYDVGDACGTCGRGEALCRGSMLFCSDVTNACGGCAELEGIPREPCETCGSSPCWYECTSEEVLDCVPR